ncbi:delta(24(24))-sterol reductase [Moniliophthora roreri]|nr:delta(24(24))-sterol reductase [Moniliophthora roreri]
MAWAGCWPASRELLSSTSVSSFLFRDACVPAFFFFILSSILLPIRSYGIAIFKSLKKHTFHVSS